MWATQCRHGGEQSGDDVNNRHADLRRPLATEPFLVIRPLLARRAASQADFSRSGRLPAVFIASPLGGNQIKVLERT
jgi:hypothetical protein